MENETKSGVRTLVLSVLMSLPGPLILGLGLRVGHSSTQLSDFTRRSAELLALIAALAVYVRTHRTGGMDERKKALYERTGNTFTGIIMCISGAAMILVTLLSGNTDKGNVIPALAVAFLGVLANTAFWRRYTVLYRSQRNSVLGVQARLYGAKSLVDTCVTSALAAVVLFPKTPAAFWLDRIGSVLVSLYMIFCGIRTVREQRKTALPQ